MKINVYNYDLWADYLDGLICFNHIHSWLADGEYGDPFTMRITIK